MRWNIRHLLLAVPFLAILFAAVALGIENHRRLLERNRAWAKATLRRTLAQRARRVNPVLIHSFLDPSSRATTPPANQADFPSREVETTTTRSNVDDPTVVGPRSSEDRHVEALRDVRTAVGKARAASSAEDHRPSTIDHPPRPGADHP